MSVQVIAAAQQTIHILLNLTKTIEVYRLKGIKPIT